MFAHLHVRSDFSFLYGAATPETLAARGAALSLPALALTDRAGVYGAVRFTKAARKARVRPILGAELPLTNGTFLVLLVEDSQGWANLCRLLTAAHLGRERGHPAASLEQVSTFSRGLVCLSGGRDSQLWRLAEAGEQNRAWRWLARLKDVFGEALYVEVIDHGLRGDHETAEALRLLAQRAGVKAVAANDVSFAEPVGFPIHRALVDIQRTIHHRRVEPAPNEQAYLKAASEMAALHPPETLATTLEVAERCRFELRLGRLHPPRYLDLRPGESAQQRLTRLCYEEMPHHYGSPVPGRAIQQLDHELGVIGRRGLADYFLVVREIVDFARGQKIPETVRGSAAGSLVTYLICGGVDPLAQGLLFERFLNEDREDMPDIDLDFDSERRDEVLAHVLDHYGLERSAMVATVPTFRARSAVRELAWVRGYERERIDALSQFLPYYLRGSQIEEALAALPELAEHPLAEERELLDIAAGFDGLPRNLSVHLGGVVITDDLLSISPVELSAKGFPVIQFDKDDAAALGLVKLDLLGLRMHTAIAKTLAALRERGIDLDFDRLPLDDPATYELLRSTDTVGIFQVESPGQRSLIGRLQPETFADLIIEISLFRPGPMQADMVAPYLKERLNKWRPSGSEVGGSVSASAPSARSPFQCSCLCRSGRFIRARDALCPMQAQQMPPRHEQIGQRARYKEPVGVLRQPSVAHLHEPEHPLDDPD